MFLSTDLNFPLVLDVNFSFTNIEEGIQANVSVKPELKEITKLVMCKCEWGRSGEWVCSFRMKFVYQEIITGIESFNTL